MKLNNRCAKEEQARRIRVGAGILITLTWLGTGISFIVQQHGTMSIIMGSLFIAGALAFIGVPIWFMLIQKMRPSSRAFGLGDIAFTVLTILIPITMVSFWPFMTQFLHWLNK